MSALEFGSVCCLAVGTLFFVAAALGLLRFPSTYLRLHAITKGDNLGLGFIVLGLALQSGSPWIAGKLALIWVLALLASTNTAFIIGRRARRHAPPEDQP